MSGGPVPKQQREAPSAVPRSSGHRSEGSSPGRSALKNSLRGKDFDAQVAMLSPGETSTIGGAKPGREGGGAPGTVGGREPGLPMFAGRGGGGGSTAEGAGEKEGGGPIRNERQAQRDKMWAVHKGDKTTEPAATRDVAETDGKDSQTKGDPRAVEADKLMGTIGADLAKMGQTFAPFCQPDGTYVFHKEGDFSRMLTGAQFRAHAEKVLAMHDDFNPTILAMMVTEFPQWVMENCYILPEEQLRQAMRENPYRLMSNIGEMKRGAPPPQGIEAAFAAAGKQARKALDPAKSVFFWTMFAVSGCILGGGLAFGAAFEIARGALQMAWAGIPDENNGLKDVMADALKPPPLTLQTAGPMQRHIIKKYYFDDDTLVHRYFNKLYPDIPFPLRMKLARSMMNIA